MPKTLLPGGQEKLLETNEETLPGEPYHWDIVGHLPLLSSPDEDQDATKASLAPSTSSAEKERTASTGSAPRLAGPNSEGAPSSTGSSSDTPSSKAITTGTPPPLRTTAQPTTTLTRSLRSTGPARDANSGGFDARTLQELQRLGPYNKPTSDYAHEMEYASLVQYAYIHHTNRSSIEPRSSHHYSTRQFQGSNEIPARG